MNDRRSVGMRGASMVEFAIILPVMALILLGIIDLGRVFYTYEALANAAREGARYCALHPGDDSGTRTRVAEELDTRVDPDLSLTICEDRDAGSPVTVAAAAVFTPVTPMISDITGGSMVVSATSTMVVWQ